MREFKVGDKVRILNTKNIPKYLIGQIGILSDGSSKMYHLEFIGVGFTKYGEFNYDDELCCFELIEDEIETVSVKNDIASSKQQETIMVGEDCHMHAELMLEYAKDALKSKTPWENWQYSYDECNWYQLHENPDWSIITDYRRKPIKIMI